MQGTSSPLLELLLYTSYLYLFIYFNQDQNNKTSNFVICLQSSQIKEIHFKIKLKKKLIGQLVVLLMSHLLRCAVQLFGDKRI